MSTQVKISEIDRDAVLKVRHSIDKDAVKRYIDSDKLTPPIDLFKIDGKLKLAGGWHRLAAAAQRGDNTIAATIHRGTIEDALAFALTDNAKHGVPLSVDERDEAIGRLTELGWSQQKIAAELSVAVTSVGHALKVNEVIKLAQRKEIKGIKYAVLREIAQAPRGKWEELITAAAKHKWSAIEIKQAIGNIGDRRLTDAQKTRVLKSGAPIAYDDEGEPGLIGDTVKRVMGESTETDAYIKLGDIEAAIMSLCNKWTPKQIIDGCAKMGQKDFDLLLKELPEEIALLQAILEEAQSRGKLKLVAS